MIVLMLIKHNKILGIGTYNQLARVTNCSKKSLYTYITPAYIRHNNNHFKLFRISHDTLTRGNHIGRNNDGSYSLYSADNREIRLGTLSELLPLINITHEMITNSMGDYVI